MDLIQVPEHEMLSEAMPGKTENDLNARFRKTFEIIKDVHKAAIITHVNPDGDAIGSALALFHYLKEKGKEAKVLIPGDLPHNLEFLPDADSIIVFNPETDEKYLKDNDTIFILDLNHIERIKQIGESYLKSKTVKVVVDHHQDATIQADLLVIDTEASSTGELIYKIIKNDPANNIISPDIAECLYAAIMTDTGSFRYPRTDAELHRIVADLIDSGADPVKIYDQVYNTTSIRRARLLGIGFANIEDYFEGRLALMMIRKEDFEKTGAVEDDVEGFVENILTLKGVSAGILMIEVEERNEIRVSFRSKGEFFIKDLAKKFGGGGHNHAAGARVKNISINELKVLLLEQAEKIFYPDLGLVK